MYYDGLKMVTHPALLNTCPPGKRRPDAGESLDPAVAGVQISLYGKSD